MKTIELFIGEKWFKVATLENVTDRILDAIIDSYACVDAFRIKYGKEIIVYTEL